MNTLPTVYHPPAVRDPSVASPTNSAAQTPTVPALVIADARTAANDDAAEATPSAIDNPLWIIAIGMAFFFGGAAAVMALT
jgi:hypothetical protein